MKYLSTRATAGGGPALSFEEVLLGGLAPDGGLYVPERWPQFSAAEIRALRGRAYAEIALRVIEPFLGGCFPRAELEILLADSYAGFDHVAVAPLRQLGAGEWLLELFHGPTLSFKDYALQVVGRMFDAVLARRHRRIAILGATSGDTGSAAIEACRDREHVDIFILYPAGRVSAVQRRQMTCVAAGNVHALAVEGTFDDCQDIVKNLFGDAAFRAAVGLTAVNSINWARIVCQIVYYFAAATALGAPDARVAFTVPTGNFGNVLAAHAARAMGLPIARLTVATNRNDILYRFIETGEMRIGGVEPSLSPSMDIQVSSNFERLFHEVLGRDGAAVAAAMAEFRRSGVLPASAEAWREVRRLFAAGRVDDEATRSMIATLYRESGELVDPHSAIAVAAGRARPCDADIARVAVATAHPAKFPETVNAATGRAPELPPRLADLMRRPERIQTLACDAAAVRDFMLSKLEPR